MSRHTEMRPPTRSGGASKDDGPGARAASFEARHRSQVYAGCACYGRAPQDDGLARPPSAAARTEQELLPIQRLGAGRLAGRVERDLLDTRLGLAQQIFAAALERLAALVDGDRFLERHLALFEPLDDRLELLDRPLERQFRDIGVVVLRHCPALQLLYFCRSSPRKRGPSKDKIMRWIPACAGMSG